MAGDSWNSVRRPANVGDVLFPNASNATNIRGVALDRQGRSLQSRVVPFARGSSDLHRRLPECVKRQGQRYMYTDRDLELKGEALRSPPQRIECGLDSDDGEKGRLEEVDRAVACGGDESTSTLGGRRGTLQTVLLPYCTPKTCTLAHTRIFPPALTNCNPQQTNAHSQMRHALTHPNCSRRSSVSIAVCGTSSMSRSKDVERAATTGLGARCDDARRSVGG